MDITPTQCSRFKISTLLAILGGLLLGLLSPGQARAGDPVFVPSNPAVSLIVANYNTPELVDIDSDGDLDAFIGQSNGDTLYFENIGHPGQPRFAEPQTNPFGLANVIIGSTPALADIDADGDLDAFIGSSFDEDIHYFENSGTATSPAFASAQTNPFGLVRPSSSFWSSPVLVDFDADGDLDLFVGDFYGDLYYYQNTGSATSPAFAAGQTNPFGLMAGLDVQRMNPALADIDNDDDLDAFIGADGGHTYFFENTGSPSSPVFAPYQSDPFGLDQRDGFGTGFFSSPTLVDIDADGDLDALIGDLNGRLLYFDNSGSPFSPAFTPVPYNPFGLTDLRGVTSPALADIDGDGDLDAFIGDHEGDTFYFRNNGSPVSPAFAPPQTNPFGLTNVGIDSSPFLANIDGDGELDVFIGNQDGNILYFANSGSPTNPSFASPQINPFGLIDVGSTSSPELADLDGDGDLDALIGRWQNGDALYFANSGSPTSPAFAAPLINPFGLAPQANFLCHPASADIDGDADLDLLIGDSQHTLYYENVGSRSSPTFASPQTDPFGLKRTGSTSDPVLVDIDADGDLDAFIGDGHGHTIFYRNEVKTVYLPLILKSFS